MKFLSHVKFPYAARLYDFTITGAGETTQVNYFYDHDIKFAGSVGGGRMVIYLKEKIKVNAQIDTVTSSDGTLVDPDENYPETGTTYRVVSCDPVLNAFGRREQFKVKLAEVTG